MPQNTKTQKIVKSIVTHDGPHLDEFFAEWLLWKFGEEFFCFENNLTHGSISTSVGNIADQHPDTIFLGVGGGPFDDHGSKHQKSCCELVAEYLDVQDRPQVIKLLKAISLQDKKAGRTKNTFTIPRMINQMHRYGLMTERFVKEVPLHQRSQVLMEKIRNWIFAWLDAVYESEDELLISVKRKNSSFKSEEERKFSVRKDFMKIHRPWEMLTIPACSKLLGNLAESWASFPSEASKLQSAAFAKAKELAKDHVLEIKTEAGVVRVLSIDGSNGEYQDCELEFDAVSRNIQNIHIVHLSNSNGNTFIGANKHFNGNLRELVGSIRQLEAELRDICLSPDQLYAQGSIEELPQWHVHEMTDVADQYRRIYNGSTTRKYTEPSLISFAQLQHLIKESVIANSERQDSLLLEGAEMKS